MRIFEDLCVGCPPEIGCLGATCPHKNVPIYYCDDCEEQNELYEFEGYELCADCILKRLPKVEGSFY